MLGMATSVTLAAGAMIDPETPWMIFWLTIITGGIYGSIIDMLATRFGGEGKTITE